MLPVGAPPPLLQFAPVAAPGVKLNHFAFVG